MAPPNIILNVIPADQLATEKAFQKLLPEIDSVPDSELISITIDVMGVVTLLLGAWPELQALRPELEAQLRKFDFERYDKLEEYALALSYANTRYRSASTPKGDVIKLADELAVIRDRFLDNALSLANHDLLDGTRLKECKTANGYRPLISDVFILIEVFKDNWKTVEGKTPITPEVLSKAGNLGLELLTAIGQKDQAPVLAGEAALTRQRAFALFSRVYQEARDAVKYVRRKSRDADAIIPSLYAGRGPRRRSDEADAPETPAAAPATNADTERESSPAQVDNPPLRINNPLGLPVTPPFVS